MSEIIVYQDACHTYVSLDNGKTYAPIFVDFNTGTYYFGCTYTTEYSSFNPPEVWRK